MRRIVAAAGLVAAYLACAPVRAEENWAPHLSGVTEGMADGAMPPEGAYMINVFQYSSDRYFDNWGHKTQTGTVSWVDVPVALWVPGVTVLGGSYAMAIAQPVDVLQTSLSRSGPTVSRFGPYATVLIPGELAWALPADFHVKAGVSVYLPDGDFNSHVPIANSIGFWSFEPTLGVSWLHAGWAANIKASYSANLRNPATSYRSGDVLSADYSVTRRFGAWKAGIGGYGVVQTTNDSQPDTVFNAGNRERKAAVGVIGGYDFGRFSVDLYSNHPVYAANCMEGNDYWMRLTAPF
jgi:hypothetical protein